MCCKIERSFFSSSLDRGRFFFKEFYGVSYYGIVKPNEFAVRQSNSNRRIVLKSMAQARTHARNDRIVSAVSTGDGASENPEYALPTLLDHIKEKKVYDDLFSRWTEKWTSSMFSYHLCIML